MNEVWARGGAGGEELANEVLEILSQGQAQFAPLYDAALPIREKISIVASRVYGASGVDYAPEGRAEHRLPAIHRTGQHADLHGEDAVLAER